MPSPRLTKTWFWSVNGACPIQFAPSPPCANRSPPSGSSGAPSSDSRFRPRRGCLPGPSSTCCAGSRSRNRGALKLGRVAGQRALLGLDLVQPVGDAGARTVAPDRPAMTRAIAAGGELAGGREAASCGLRRTCRRFGAARFPSSCRARREAGSPSPRAFPRRPGSPPARRRRRASAALQRPHHPRLVDPDPDPGRFRLADAEIVERLAHVEIGFPAVRMPRRGLGLSQTVRSIRSPARSGARRKPFPPAAGPRSAGDLAEPDRGVGRTSSSGTTISRRSGSTVTLAELSTVSVRHLNPTRCRNSATSPSRAARSRRYSCTEAGCRTGIIRAAKLCSDWVGRVEETAPWSSPTRARTPPCSEVPAALAWRIASIERSSHGPLPYQIANTPS